MASWFTTLGRWEQDKAYAAFDLYRDDPTEQNYSDAVVLAIAIIRVVIATQKFKINYGGDEDDLIAHAAFIITKALPKMARKPKEKLDNDKKYMRYLFTCVVNAFAREYSILHGKHNRLQKKINDHSEPPTQRTAIKNVRRLEAQMTLKQLPQHLFEHSLTIIRFTGNERNICAYIIRQLIDEREVSKSVLQLMGCKNRDFFITYCNNLLYRAFIGLKDYTPSEEFEYEDLEANNDVEAVSLLDIETMDYDQYYDPEESYDGAYAD